MRVRPRSTWWRVKGICEVVLSPHSRFVVLNSKHDTEHQFLKENANQARMERHSTTKTTELKGFLWFDSLPLRQSLPIHSHRPL